jgi:hypothetical protein
MEHLEHPPAELWNERRDWFEGLIFEQEQRAGFMIGEQASALTADVQACFCAGAWCAVIVLAFSVIEANLRETETWSKSAPAVKVVADEGEDVQALRKARNRLVHAQADDPAVTVDQQWFERDGLEAEAKLAVMAMIKSLFRHPWV